MQRVIMHIDMNSYFASCEQQDNPAWRGRPLGVCEHLGGIIIAPSIEAKRWGIKTGMPVWEAKKLYPKIILTKTHPDRYRFYTRRFLNLFADYTDAIEKYSIDEAFLDVTLVCNVNVPYCHSGLDPESRHQNTGSQIKFGMTSMVDPFEEAATIVQEIKRRMKTEVGDWLQCSVGVAWNKLVAKIASDMQKPNGLVVVRPEDKDMLYNQLHLIDIPGIGSRQEQNLYKLGIMTLRDLRDYPVTKLVAHFGITGYHFHNMGQLEGSFKEGFGAEAPMKSIGHMYTVPLEYRSQGVLLPVLYKLCEMVAARLRLNGFMGRTLSLHVHTDKENCFGKSLRLDYDTQDGRDVFLECVQVLSEAGIDAKTKVFKLVGVTVGSLAPHTQQPSLFAMDNKKQGALSALDRINEKYGDFTIARVPAFQAQSVLRDSIGFGRMKEFKVTGKFYYGH